MSFYFFHEFWSEILIFHTMNVLAMFSTPIQYLFVGLTGYNMVAIGNPYVTTCDCFHVYIMWSYLLKRSYIRKGCVPSDQTNTITLEKGELKKQV
jgi:hypothetical protein